MSRARRTGAWTLAAVVSLIAASHAAAADRAPLRIHGGGNELIVAREAPVAYTRLEQLVEDLRRSPEPRAAPIRVVRAWPPALIDYVLCVTSDGTLVVGEQTQTFDPGVHRFVVTKREIARSYRPLHTTEGWLWLVEVVLSRDTRVTLELRAPGPWPVEGVTVTTDHMP
jgi:hypothetical protein